VLDISPVIDEFKERIKRNLAHFMFHFEFFIESVQHCAHILELRDQEFPSLETLQLDSNDEICINKLLDAI
jgi:hypothetical protein